MATREDNQRLGAGFIGLGMAGAGMVRSLAEHPDVSIAAAADRFPAPREAFARDFEAEVYEDAEALCESPNVESLRHTSFTKSTSSWPRNTASTSSLKSRWR